MWRGAAVHSKDQPDRDLVPATRRTKIMPTAPHRYQGRSSNHNVIIGSQRVCTKVVCGSRVTTTEQSDDDL
jgi:hypothetical protein